MVSDAEELRESLDDLRANDKMIMLRVCHDCELVGRLRIAFSAVESEPCANDPRITQLKNTASVIESLLRSNRNSFPPPESSATNEVARDLCSNIEASQEDCTVLVADRSYLPLPEICNWHVSVGHLSSNSEVIQEDCTVHMTEKDCAPSPEIASKKMLPGDSSANNEASQEDMFICSVATEVCGAMDDDSGVEVSGSVDDDTVDDDTLDDCSREEDLHCCSVALMGKNLSKSVAPWTTTPWTTTHWTTVPGRKIFIAAPSHSWGRIFRSQWLRGRRHRGRRHIGRLFQGGRSSLLLR